MLITQKSLQEIAEWSQLARPRKLTKTELLNCIENKPEVVQLMQLPGRLYTGPRKEYLAALKITSLFKVCDFFTRWQRVPYFSWYTILGTTRSSKVSRPSKTANGCRCDRGVVRDLKAFPVVLLTSFFWKMTSVKVASALSDEFHT